MGNIQNSDHIHVSVVLVCQVQRCSFQFWTVLDGEVSSGVMLPVGQWRNEGPCQPAVQGHNLRGAQNHRSNVGNLENLT